MDGNVLLCMNYPYKSYGNILDNKEKSPIVITDYYSHLARKRCMRCPWVCACFGIYPICETDEDRKIVEEHLKEEGKDYFS